MRCASASRKLTNGQFLVQPLCGRRNCWRGAGVRCRPARQRRMRSHAERVLFRQGSGLRLQFRRRLRRQCAPAGGVAVLRRRPRTACARCSRSRHPADSLRQCRRADGRLVSQGDQLPSTTSRDSSPHRRARRRDPGKARRGAAADPHRRHLFLRSSAARSMRPNGSVPTTTRSSGCTRSPSTTTTPGWWEGSAMITLLVNAPALGGAAAVFKDASRPRATSRTC